MDANETRDALRLLTDLLPSVAERMSALLAEETAAKQAAEDFLERCEERQGEAADLLGRVEAVQLELRAQAAAESDRLARWEDPTPDLHDPALAFDEKAALLLAPFARAQARHVAVLRDTFNGQREQRLLNRGQRMSATRFQLEKSGDGLLRAWDDAGRGAADLQGVVETSRATLSHDLERLGADLDALQSTTARDVEEVRRDLEGYDSVFVSRLDRVREVMRQDAENLLDDARERMSELQDLLERCISDVTRALQALEQQTREAGSNAEAAREALVPLFDNLEERIPHLRHALEQVREAAHTVGIAF
jgi:chromosome segregation ATPase